MGLDMKLFSLVLALTLFTACIKKEEEETVSDGPSADSNAVAEAETESLEDHNLLDAVVGDFVVFEVTAQPFNSNPQILQYLTSQVMEKNDSGLFYELAILRRTIVPKDDGTDDVSETMDRCKVYKDSGESTCAPANLESQSARMTKTTNFALPAAIVPQGGKLKTLGKQVTVHNYSRTVLAQDPPPVVKNSPDCGGTPNCLLRTTRIEYDIIVREDNDRQRYRITREFSPDAPASAVENRLCQSSNQKINGRLIPVILCYTLVNYKYGGREAVELNTIKQKMLEANAQRTLASAQPNETTLRLNAKRTGIDPYQVESLQFRVDGVGNGRVSGRATLMDSNGNTLRDGPRDCDEASAEADCQGYPLLDPALMPAQNGLTKFYNFSFVSYKTALPESVRNRRGCTDQAACPMSATLLRFEREDIVEGKVLRTIHALEVSPDVPVLNAMSFRCSRGFVGSWPQLTSTRSCMILTDFLP